MKPSLLLAAALLFAAGSAGARGPVRVRALCQGNPKLDEAAFIVIFTPDAGEAPTRLVFAFDHCAVSGREKGRPMEVQRAYQSDGLGSGAYKPDGQGFGLATQMGSLISSARLYASRSRPEGVAPWTVELGPFFTSDLLSGDVVGAGHSMKGRFTIQGFKPYPAKN